MKNIYLVLCLLFSVIISVDAQHKQVGNASYYHNKFNGRKTASGEIFSNKKMTCASNRLKLGTIVKVTNLKNKKSVVVRVNDRLAANNKRILDLTYAAAKKLGFIESGLAKVEVEILDKHHKIKEVIDTEVGIEKDSTQ